MQEIKTSTAKYTQNRYTVAIVTSTSTIVFLSTYPPRECGIATFTQDLLDYTQKFLGPLVTCKVAALNLSPLDTHNYPPEVAWEIDQNSKDTYLQFAKTCNTDDQITGIIIQHEYGIFGGLEGENLLTFMENCNKPMLVTLHTTLPVPSPKMKSVTARIIKLASTLVVLTTSSKEIVERLYPEARQKISVIPHGIHPSVFSDTSRYKAKLELKEKIVLTTFGLLSRGKGIEYVLHALPNVIKKYPSVLYLILGKTHPVIARNEGEEYRLELAALITKLGLEKHVRFYDQYFSLPNLLSFLKATDIYIATSINPNQAVSGTLSYALGTGLAVISTDFSQAKEIVTTDTGRLVPIKNSPAITSALFDLLSDTEKLEQMHLNAYTMTRPMLWSNVAEKYTALLTHLIIPTINLDHLHTMTDDFGLFQFAKGSTPDKNHGYTLDDNARALIVCNWLSKKSVSPEIETLIRIYLTFIRVCQKDDGSFTNYLSFPEKMPTKQNTTEDLQEANARALWGLAETISNLSLPKNLRDEALVSFRKHLKSSIPHSHLRATAFTIKAFALVLPHMESLQKKLLTDIKKHADALSDALSKHSINSWRWFEKDLSYNNALLPESLLIAGKALKNDEYTQLGLSTLDFLISKTFSKTYMPIGHELWYENKQKRSEYDQQPEDPASMILALTKAYEYTHELTYKTHAVKCFSWFMGNNSLKKSLYDKKTGGCYDGLHPDRVNLNEGAESLVSYLMANITISQIQEVISSD